MTVAQGRVYARALPDHAGMQTVQTTRRAAHVALSLALSAAPLGTLAAASSGPWPAATAITGGGDDATTIIGNPAGMSRLGDGELVLQVAGITTESQDDLRAPGLGLAVGDSDNNLIAGPTFAWVRRLSERWHAGATMFVPGGFGDDYGDQSVTRYLVEEWSLVFVSLAPALSYAVTDRLSIGASVPVNYALYTVESSVLNLDGPDGELELDADGVSVNYTAGAMYEFDQGTRLGLSYRSKVDAELEGEPDFSGLTDLTRTILETAGLLDLDVEIESTLPPVWLAGARHDFGAVSAALDVSRIGWSDFRLTEFAFLDGARILRRGEYDDSWALSAGVNFPIAPRWRLGLGAAWMDSPVDEDTRTFLFRVDDTVSFGIGVEYDRGEGRTMTLNIDYVDFGEGRIATQPLPIIGGLEAEYEEHYGIVVDFRMRWR